MNELVLSGAAIIMISSDLPEMLGMRDSARAQLPARGVSLHDGGRSTTWPDFGHVQRRAAKTFTRGEATPEKLLYVASGGK
ncbi:hypothetical protein [Paenibacillus sp. y28]|uniref:hypothetical protein n=1 Tax=Paenibacillus sp. y28 TaxID=3129110 RepID=UPI0030198F3B